MPQESEHNHIVKKVLPRIAEKLKEEGIISSHDTEQIDFPLFENNKSLVIRPDRVLHLPNGDKVLVEVANQREPKRFVGEIVYPAILKKMNKIKASLVFVIGNRKSSGRSVKFRSMVSELVGKYSSCFVTYPDSEDAAYDWIKHFIKVACQTKMQKPSDES